MARPDITIIGGGIGGLACSIALAQHGFGVRVLEQAEQISEVGAGLQITPNGMRVLDALEVGHGLRSGDNHSDAVILRDYRQGAQVVRMDLAGQGQSGSYQLVHRADLVGLLAQRAADVGVHIQTGQTVTDIRQTDTSMTITLGDGAEQNCDIVIGADGLHSVVRKHLNGCDKPFFTGQTAWRALIPGGAVSNHEVSVFMGPGRHLVTYPLRGGELTNIVAVEERQEWTEEGWNHAGDPDDLRRAFAAFGGTVPDLLKQVEKVNVWGLFRHPVAENWHGSHCAILGDAAHPTLPFLAQGANLALEDSWVLADCLAKETGDAALATYQQKRRDRVVRAIKAANANARNYHLRNPLIRAGAHTALRTLGALAPNMMQKRFDWLYGVDVTQQ